MPLMDCLPPLATPGQTAKDLIDRLNMMPLNIIRFSRFSYDGGASAVIPFTDPPVPGAQGAQRKAIAFAGGVDGAAILADRTWGGQTLPPGGGPAGKNGAAYNISFDAWIEGADTGSDLTAVFLSTLDAPLDNIDPQVFAVTGVPQTFTWEHVSSDDPDFVAAEPNNAVFKLLVAGADLAPGSILYVTNFQIQLDDFWAPRPIEFPWRPAKGEEDLAQYGDYIVSIGRADLAAKAGEALGVDFQSGNLQPRPTGDRTMPLESESYTLQRIDDGRKLRTVGDVEITVPAYADVEMRMHARAGGRVLDDGSVTLVPAVGVTINLPAGQGLVITGEGRDWFLHKVGEDEWDLELPATDGTALAATPIYMPLASGTSPPSLIGLGDGRLVPILWGYNG